VEAKQVERLIAAWQAVDCEAPPIGLPEDLALVRGTQHEVTFRSYQDWVASGGLGKSSSSPLHLGLVPVPYVGHLNTASVWLLMLNPGLEPDNYFAEEHVAPFRAASVSNLRQELGDTDFPFLYLDPRFAWHSTGRYWRTRLNWLVLELAENLSMSYMQALRWVAQCLACVQLVPYWSSDFDLPDSITQRLQSVQLARNAVREVLESCGNDERLVIVMRSGDRWQRKGRLGEGLPGSASGRSTSLCYRPPTRGAFLSPGGDLGRRVFEFLRAGSSASKRGSAPRRRA
jgi:hypothetical protein